MCFNFIDFETQNLEFLNDLECSHSYHNGVVAHPLPQSGLYM